MTSWTYSIYFQKPEQPDEAFSSTNVVSDQNQQGNIVQELIVESKPFNSFATENTSKLPPAHADIIIEHQVNDTNEQQLIIPPSQTVPQENAENVAQISTESKETVTESISNVEKIAKKPAVITESTTQHKGKSYVLSINLLIFMYCISLYLY